MQMAITRRREIFYPSAFALVTNCAWINCSQDDKFMKRQASKTLVPIQYQLAKFVINWLPAHSTYGLNMCTTPHKIQLTITFQSQFFACNSEFWFPHSQISFFNFQQNNVPWDEFDVYQTGSITNNQTNTTSIMFKLQWQISQKLTNNLILRPAWTNNTIFPKDKLFEVISKVIWSTHNENSNQIDHHNDPTIK